MAEVSPSWQAVLNARDVQAKAEATLKSAKAVLLQAQLHFITETFGLSVGSVVVVSDSISNPGTPSLGRVSKVDPYFLFSDKEPTEWPAIHYHPMKKDGTWSLQNRSLYRGPVRLATPEEVEARRVL